MYTSWSCSSSARRTNYGNACSGRCLWLTDTVLVLLFFVFQPPSLAVSRSLGLESWLVLLAIGFFNLALSMVPFYWLIQRIDVTQASPSIQLQPLFGVGE